MSIKNFGGIHNLLIGCQSHANYLIYSIFRIEPISGIIKSIKSFKDQGAFTDSMLVMGFY